MTELQECSRNESTERCVFYPWWISHRNFVCLISVAVEHLDHRSVLEQPAGAQYIPILAHKGANGVPGPCGIGSTGQDSFER